MFHVLLLEQDTTTKRRINEFTEVPKFDKGDNKEYEVKAIQNSVVYTKKVDRYLSGLYYLVV